MVAALYVDPNGAYAGLPDVEVWDEERDARLYAGPWPVVAHPPCNRWGQLARVNHSRWGTKLGEDGGCFKAALEAVRRFGGVLEHPAHSLAWRTFGLPRPRPGSWQQPFDDDGFVTEVSQVAYGHPARKRTWLYALRRRPCRARLARAAAHARRRGRHPHGRIDVGTTRRRLNANADRVPGCAASPSGFERV
jgi:hypothetical protein